MENIQEPKSFGRGKKFRQYYPQYRNKFNITEEIEKTLGTAHRLDNLNANKFSLQESSKKDDIEGKFDNPEISTSGWVPMEYQAEVKQLENEANVDNYGFEEDATEHAKQQGKGDESGSSLSYNTVLTSPENSFETADENGMNGEKGDKKSVDEQKKVETHDVVTLRAIPVKAASKNIANNSKNFKVLSFKAKLIKKYI